MAKYLISEFSRTLLLIFLCCSSYYGLQAQVDTTKQQTGEPMSVTSDTSQVAPQKGKKEYKRRNDFKVFGGITSSKLNVSGSEFESAFAVGYDLGVSYRQGRFAYWELGLRFYGSAVDMKRNTSGGVPSPLSERTVGIRQMELPFTVGLNLLSPARRILGLRLFLGVSPAVIFDVGDNSLGLSDDNINTFQFAAHTGVGVDILFLFVEGGYNYGFTDVLSNDQSNLSQLYLNLGFRF